MQNQNQYQENEVNLYVNNHQPSFGGFPETKKKRARKLFLWLLFAVFLLLILLFITLIVVDLINGDELNGPVVTRNKHHKSRRRLLQEDENVNPSIERGDNPWFDEWNDLPQPGVPYEYFYQNQMQNMTLNPNVTYYKPETTLYCMIEFDEDGNLDSNTSYIQILDDFSGTVHVDSILLAGAPHLAHMNANCTVVPAVMVTEIINDTSNGILTLKIREVEMFDYIDEVDCNITNATLIDSGVEIGEIQRVKNLANYFSNNTKTVINGNGTMTNISFTNITYTEMETICFNVSEDGTIINNITMINGICDDLNAVDYFGQQYGIDSIRFGDTVINGSGESSLYGVDSNPNRRRLFGRFFKKIVNKIKTVVKKVVNVVKDIIDILRGDINKRIFELSLSIDASHTHSVSAIEDTSIGIAHPDIDDVSISASGTFNVESGVDFFSSIHADLVAKYTIFSKNPSFDLFRLTVGGETRFKAYVDITIDGNVNIAFEIARVERRQILMLGPIPVVIRPYAAVSFGVEADLFLDFAFEFGYHPTSFVYGVEWNKQDGDWKSIQKPLVFEPFKNFGSETTDHACLSYSVAPFVEVQIGVVFYEIVDVHIIPTIKLITQFQFPATCSLDIDQCSHSPFQANFGIDFEFAISIGLEVGLLVPELSDIVNLPSISTSFELPFNIPPISLFDTCFPIQSSVFSLIGDSCCALNEEDGGEEDASYYYVTSQSEIRFTDELGVITRYGFDTAGHLVIDVTITNRGCGGTQSHYFAAISDFIDGNLFTKWNKIRYTMEFFGESSCWAILGDTTYGDWSDDFDGFGLIEGSATLIDDSLLYGTWDIDETFACNNNRGDNFWLNPQAVSSSSTAQSKGTITVEQERDLNVENAGIGSGHSCSTLSPNTRVRFADIMVVY